MVSGIRPTLNTFKRIYWNDKNIKEILQMITKKEIPQKALELCWEIEKLPASEQQTKISIMASELHRLVDGFVMQAVPPSDATGGISDYCDKIFTIISENTLPNDFGKVSLAIEDIIVIAKQIEEMTLNRLQGET